jgi:hypothetical protein
VSLQPVTAGPSERQAVIETIQVQWAVLAELDVDELLRALSFPELHRLATALAALCTAVRDPDDDAWELEPPQDALRN